MNGGGSIAIADQEFSRFLGLLLGCTEDHGIHARRTVNQAAKSFIAVFTRGHEGKMLYLRRRHIALSNLNTQRVFHEFLRDLFNRFWQSSTEQPCVHFFRGLL